MVVVAWQGQKQGDQLGGQVRAWPSSRMVKLGTLWVLVYSSTVWRYNWQALLMHGTKQIRVKNDARFWTWENGKIELPFLEMGKTTGEADFEGERSGVEFRRTRSGMSVVYPSGSVKKVAWNSSWHSEKHPCEDINGCQQHTDYI
jgi:hypothetical protein